MGRWSSQMTDKEVKGGREESEDGGRSQRNREESEEREGTNITVGERDKGKRSYGVDARGWWEQGTNLSGIVDVS